MPSFEYQELLPLGHPESTPYKQLSADHVSTFSANGRTFLSVQPEALTLLTRTAMRDIAHLLRPGHLAQLRKILDDPEASANDRFVALELLKNANIASGYVLPGCQDTGTAIVMGKKGQFVITGGGDEEAISRGIYDTYTTTNLRYSQVSPVDMFEEKNTGTNRPAEIHPVAPAGDRDPFPVRANGRAPWGPPRARRITSRSSSSARAPSSRSRSRSSPRRATSTVYRTTAVPRATRTAIWSGRRRSSASRARPASARSSAASTSCTTRA